MGKRAALILLGLTAFAGGVSSLAPWSREGQLMPADWILMALGLLWLFFWLAADQRQLGYRRSPWMNVGIVLLAVVFVPVYLVRSRPAGRKLLAFGGFLLALLGWVLASVLGAFAALPLFAPEAA